MVPCCIKGGLGGGEGEGLYQKAVGMEQSPQGSGQSSELPELKEHLETALRHGVWIFGGAVRSQELDSRLSARAQRCAEAQGRTRSSSRPRGVRCGAADSRGLCCGALAVPARRCRCSARRALLTAGSPGRATAVPSRAVLQRGHAAAAAPGQLDRLGCARVSALTAQPANKRSAAGLPASSQSSAAGCRASVPRAAPDPRTALRLRTPRRRGVEPRGGARRPEAPPHWPRGAALCMPPPSAPSHWPRAGGTLHVPARPPPSRAARRCAAVRVGPAAQCRSRAVSGVRAAPAAAAATATATTATRAAALRGLAALGARQRAAPQGSALRLVPAGRRTPPGSRGCSMKRGDDGTAG